jgi:ABC-2 type transport system permease protein
MRKVWAVIRREFIERVRTKWFLISTILGPIFMVTMTVLPSLLTMKTGRINDVIIVDEGAGPVLDRLQAQLSRSGRFTTSVMQIEPERHQAVLDSLTAAVTGQTLDGFMILLPTTVEIGSAEYRGRNVSSLRDMEILNRSLRQAILVERLNRVGVDPGVVQEAQANIELRTLRISRRGATGESGEATFILGYFVGLILYMVILLYGINVMRSVIEEKQNRIVEVLVSSLKAFQLLAGKVIGVGAVGLFQFGIWSFTGWLMVKFRAQILGLFGVSQAAMANLALPKVGGILLVMAGLYFLVGYVLYSSMFAAVGSACNTESEAQQAQQPVMMVLILSLMLLFPVLNDPGGRLAVVASMIPVSAPIIMPIRVAASDVPTSEIVMSLLIGVLACAAVVWVAARIYRIGILMYGKRPSIKELLRWARQS